jgi:iron complex transport system substrate-binding protein
LRRPARLTLLPFLLCLAASAEAEEISLPQADGNVLVLQQSAQRLVTLSPHLTELVYAAGAGEQLLATVEFSEFPPAASALPRVGDAFRLDVEGIVAWHPDLVIAWESGNPAAALDQLRALGLPVWSIEIRQPRAIAETLEAIGRATGNMPTANAAARQFLEGLESLRLRYEDEKTLDYFYQVDARPLFTINGDHLISQGLRLCGGNNIFSDEPGLAFQVSHESVIVADPDAIFAPGLGLQDDPLSAWRAWPGLQAVETDALYRLPADEISRATPRWLDALELACTLLHGLR